MGKPPGCDLKASWKLVEADSRLVYGGRLETAGLAANVCEAQEELLALLLFGSILSITTLNWSNGSVKASSLHLHPSSDQSKRHSTIVLLTNSTLSSLEVSLDKLGNEIGRKSWALLDVIHG